MNVQKVLDRMMRWPVVIVLGLMWAFLTRAEFHSFSEAEYETDPDVIIRYYDRELRLMEAAERLGPLGHWVLGHDDIPLARAELLDALEQGHKEAMGDDGDQLVRLLEMRVQGSPGDEAPEDAVGHDVRDWLMAGHGAAWDLEWFIHATGDARVAEFYRNQNDHLMTRGLVINGLLDGAMLLGLVVMGWLLLRKDHAVAKPHRWMRRWQVGTVIGLYFLLCLLKQPWSRLLDVFYFAFTQFMPEPLVYAGYDMAWQAFDAVLLVLLLMGGPRIAWRLFGQGKGVAWIALLAVYAVQALIDWCVFLMSPMAAVDPSDFLDVADPGPAYLMSDWFSAVVVAPIFEEVVYRGFLFQGLRGRLGNLGAGVVSTLLFTVAHAQYDVWGLLSVAVTGAGAAYLTMRTGSLTSAIAYHALINLIACGTVYVQYQLPL